MKSTNNFVRIASTLFCLLVFASASFAAKNPLNFPMGLAVDAKGNLWVANYGDNNILVFSPGYALQKETITQGITLPTGVAFDPQGNLWVTNDGNFTVTEYTGGAQITSSTITNGVFAPQGIAIDGLGNIWVNNDDTDVAVYGSPSAFTPPTNPIRTINPGILVFGMAIGAGTFSYGSSAQVNFVSADTVLQSGTTYDGVQTLTNTGFALATDARGDVYMGNFDGSVQIFVPLSGGQAIIVPYLQLSFVPSGIALDNVRERVYISNTYGNSISVYNTAGALLKTIE
jgi:DNA-binding beta-propeller fold protein YncE